MANITKIKIDGVEHQIGYGAELEWKLVATGTYDSSETNDNEIEYILDKKLEEDKLYYIERYDSNYGSFYHCFYKWSYECYIRATDRENDESCEVSLGYYEYDGVCRIQLFTDTPIYHGENDDIKVYELAIKNVVNPSNVVTPNKLNLYTTGTLYEEVQTDNTEIYYKLEKPLQPNKLYYVERYDAIMVMYFNCVIRTDYDALLKCTTKMLAGEDNCDTTIFANIAIIQSGEDDIPNLFYINGGEYSIYKDTEDTLEIYELPFEF